MKTLFNFLLLPFNFKLWSCLLILTFNHSALTIAQNNPDIRRTYHWYFGNGAGLDFSSGTPIPITNSAMTAEEGCASISDTCGNLLFYTDGDTVWDRNNNVMPNGTGLMGCWSSTQNSLIVPQPGNDSLYYIFLTDCSEHLGANGLRYSIVNMKLNSGLGEVVQKNVELYSPTREQLAATYHANKTDIWILSINRYPPGPQPDSAYQYIAYLLTDNGININPVISPSQIFPAKTGDGYLRFSHSGDKIAYGWHNGSDTIELADFNKNSGIVSNSIIISVDTNYSGSYGIVFSPDDSKLYHSVFTTDSIGDYIVQYDISSNVQSLIEASKTIIISKDYNICTFYALQIGSGNEKIYINRFKNNDSLMDIIQNPNAPGLACNYFENGVAIGCESGEAGLPNFIDSYFKGSWLPPCNTGLENSKSMKYEIKVYPNPFSDYATIHITNPEKLKIEKMNLQLYDFLGHVVLKTKISNTDYKIYKGNLNRGIYFLKIQAGNNIYTNKLIIN